MIIFLKARVHTEFRGVLTSKWDVREWVRKSQKGLQRY